VKRMKQVNEDSNQFKKQLERIKATFVTDTDGQSKLTELGVEILIKILEKLENA